MWTNLSASFIFEIDVKIFAYLKYEPYCLWKDCQSEVS